MRADAEVRAAMYSDESRVSQLMAEIERLRAELATARREERERCAVVCDRIETDLWQRYKRGEGYDRGNPHNSAASDGATQCAAAIRAMGDE